MRRLIAITALAFVVLVAGGAAADTFAVTLVSQTSSTITLGWNPQPGYGYLFSSGGVLRSRTNDPSRTSVKFSKVTPASYDIDVIVKGANGHYPGTTPPPPNPACSDGIDNDGDGKIDYPNDPGCTSATDTDETDPVATGCALPAYPDANCTGVPSGTVLTASGGITVTVAGTVINALDITGPVVVNAANVTIRNTRIRSNAMRVVDNNSTGLVIEDSEILNRPVSGQPNCHIGVGDDNFTVRRSEITGCENGLNVTGNNVVFTDNYVHDLDTVGPSYVFGNSPHTDGIQIGAAQNITISHNTIDPVGTVTGGGATSGIITDINNTNPDANAHLHIEDNYIDGREASFAIYADRAPQTDVLINRNHLRSGVYGYTNCVKVGTTVTQFNDNRDAVTNALIPPDTGGSGCPTSVPPPPVAQCADGQDNDGDGLVDLADPGCTSSSDNDETNTVTPPPTGFPDATNTGVPDGTVLTAYTGPSTITADNTVIDGKETGCLTIKATNVQIRNSYVHGNGCAVVIQEDPAVCVSASGGACTVTITDSTLSCNNAGGTAVYYRDYTVIRSDVSGCENGFDAGTNVLVKDTWVHDLWQESGAHTDDMQLSGGHVGHAVNIVVDHNHFTGRDRNGNTINAAIISNGGNGDTGVVFKNNLFGGGGWTVYCPGWQSGGTPGPGDQVVNNHWKNDYGFGHSVGCDDSALTVSGNVDYPAGNPINLG